MFSRVFIYLSVLFFSIVGIAENILYIGDSHSVGLHTNDKDFIGPKIYHFLSEEKHNVSFFASGGATVADFLWDHRKVSQPQGITKRETSINSDLKVIFRKSLGTPNISSLKKLMETNASQGVIINLGTNAMRLIKKNRISELRDDVDDMVQLVLDNKAECFWILPPPISIYKMSLKDQKTLQETIESAIAGRCSVFRSAEMLKIKPGTDGIHYGMDESNKWAEALIPALRDWILSWKDVELNQEEEKNDEDDNLS